MEDMPIKHCYKCNKDFTGWSQSKPLPEMGFLSTDPAFIKCADCTWPDPYDKQKAMEFFKKRHEELDKEE